LTYAEQLYRKAFQLQWLWGRKIKCQDWIPRRTLKKQCEVSTKKQEIWI